MDENLIRFDKKSRLEFFDFETFNLCLNSCYNLPWQIGMGTVVGDKIIDSYEAYIKWETDLTIGDGAAEITHFNRAIYDAKAIPQEQVFPIVYKRFSEADFILGHNILNFDVYLLKDWCNLHGKPWRHFVKKMIDTKAVASAVKRSIPFNKNNESLIEFLYRLGNTPVKGLKTKLETLGKEYNIDHDYDRLHDALVDIELNVKVWHKLKMQIEI